MFQVYYRHKKLSDSTEMAFLENVPHLSKNEASIILPKNKPISECLFPTFKGEKHFIWSILAPLWLF